MYIHIYIHIYMCIYIHMYIYVAIYVYVNMCMYICTHTMPNRIPVAASPAWNLNLRQPGDQVTACASFYAPVAGPSELPFNL